MSKFDDVVAKCAADLDEMGGHDAALLKAVTKALGPTIYNVDSSLVATSDKEELARIKQNFLVKKLGLADSPALDDAMAAVIAKYDKRHKKRPVFYYLLVKELGQEAAYE